MISNHAETKSFWLRFSWRFSVPQGNERWNGIDDRGYHISSFSSSGYTRGESLSFQIAIKLRASSAQNYITKINGEADKFIFILTIFSCLSHYRQLLELKTIEDCLLGTGYEQNQRHNMVRWNLPSKEEKKIAIYVIFQYNQEAHRL